MTAISVPWLAEIVRNLGVRPQLVLSGNVRDHYLIASGSDVIILPLAECLWRALEARGFDFLLICDRVSGLSVYPEGAGRVKRANEILGLDQRLDRLTLTKASELLQIATSTTKARITILFPFASRLAQDPTHLSPDEHQFFSICEHLALEAHPLLVEGGPSTPLYNPLIWVVDSENDLPVWFLARNNRIRSIPIPYPEYEDRHAAATRLAPDFPGFADCGELRRYQLIRTFADQTEGLPLQSMDAIVQLARQEIDPVSHEPLPFEKVEEAVLRYKIGASDSPWGRAYLRDRVRGARLEMSACVKGQEAAVDKTLDILKRSIMGLTGAQGSTRTGRPKGVLFFAGPTGVGKTELAKAITKSLFSDPQAYVRFDMSEFAAEHSEARLLGAPPGYIGYGIGGELTNAIRRRPFSVVLFDEIEKAHPRILDKFLQVLEDGRLTDGAGNTVYFSESVLVFTSNLGVSVKGPDGRVEQQITPDSPYVDVDEKVRAAIRDHFNLELRRPELLNRFGDNIVVFDFIRRQAALDIFEMMLANVCQRVADQHRLALTVPPAVQEHLREHCTRDLSHGGRGIGNKIETLFVNPLSRELFDMSLHDCSRITVNSIRVDGQGCRVELTPSFD
jgi:ATP-dependent Clp protease ATP-binding subunit ClpB